MEGVKQCLSRFHAIHSESNQNPVEIIENICVLKDTRRYLDRVSKEKKKGRAVIPLAKFLQEAGREFGDFFSKMFVLQFPGGLVAPYRALSGPISRDTPYCTVPSSGRLTAPQNGAIPLLVLSLTQAHLCDTPCCNMSRDIP